MSLLYDNTGVLVDNLVPAEQHLLTTSVGVFPSQGPFYLNGFYPAAVDAITSDIIPLVLNTDYVLSPLLASQADILGNDIYSYIVILDPSKWSSVSLTYQALGGDIVDSILLEEINDRGDWDRLDPSNWVRLVGETQPLYADGSSTPTDTVLGPVDMELDRIDLAVEYLNNDIDHQLTDRTIADNADQFLLSDAMVAADLVQNQSLADIEVLNLNLYPDIQTVLDLDTTQSQTLVTVLADIALHGISARLNLLTNDQNNVSIASLVARGLLQSTKYDLVSTLSDNFDDTLAQANLDNTSTTGTLSLGLSDNSDLMDAIRDVDTAQDLLISATTGVVASQAIAIADNMARDITQSNLISSLESDVQVVANDADVLDASDEAQDIILTRLEAMISSVCLGGGPDMVEIVAKIQANAREIALQLSESTANTARDLLQDIRIAENRVLLTAAQGSSIDTQPLENNITTTEILVAQYIAELTAINTVDATQDSQIASIAADISNKGGGPVGGINDLDATLLSNAISDNTAAIPPILNQLSAIEIVNLNQDFLLAQNDQVAYRLQNASFTDVSFLTTDLNQIGSLSDLYRSELSNIDGINLTQTVDADLNTSKLNSLEGNTGGDTSGLLLQINANAGRVTTAQSGLPALKSRESLQSANMLTNAANMDGLEISGGGQIDTSVLQLSTDALETSAAITAESSRVGNTILPHDTIQSAKILNVKTDCDKGTLYISANAGTIQGMGGSGTYTPGEITPIVGTPYITSPADNATVEATSVLASSSAWNTNIAGDNHSSSDWEIATDVGFTNKVFTSANNTVNKTSILISSVPLNVGLYIRVRYTGSASGITAWSDVKTFQLLDNSNALWVERSHMLQSSDIQASDNFGSGVTVNDAGTILVVGAIYEDTTAQSGGKVYTYDWNGSNWIERSHMLQASDVGSYYRFGSSVSLNSTGTILVVGAENVDESGMAYTYDWNGSMWVERSHKLQSSDIFDGDEFGSGVALDSIGNILVVGAGGEGVTGKVYTYDWDTGSSQWIERSHMLQSSDIQAYDDFGSSVALDSTGTILVVGAPWETNATGKVYTYDWNGSMWIERTQKLVPSDIDTGDVFGMAVCLDNSGTVLVVGAQRTDTTANDAGKVYTYDWNGTSWVERGHMLQSGDIAAYDYFGHSAALSSNGTMLIVGALKEETSAIDAGKVYTYDL